jgi:hypothetical protein
MRMRNVIVMAAAVVALALSAWGQTSPWWLRTRRPRRR